MLKSRWRGRGERGAVLVYTALSLALLMGFASFAIDLGYDRQVANHLQSGVDAGSLAAAQELPTAAPNATMSGTARATAAAYALMGLFDGTPPSLPTPACAADACTWTIGTTTLTVISPYTPPTGLPSTLNAQNLVLVRACAPGGAFFRQFLGNSAGMLCRSSVARRSNGPSGYRFGLVTLDPIACKALQFRGDSTTVLSSTGGIGVNSECPGDPGAFDSSGSSWNLNADFIGVVGNATLNPCAPPDTTLCTSTIPTEGIPHFADPLVLSAPAQPTTARSCNWSLAEEIVQPGYYASQCTFGSSRTYIFRPGLYYFALGFRTSGGASLICSAQATGLTLHDPSLRCPQPAWNGDGSVSQQGGVTFYVGGGDFSMAGNGTVYLPGNAYFKGATIFQSSTNCNSSVITGNTSFEIGSIYAPCAPLEFTGSGSGSEVNVRGMVIGNLVDIGGSFNFNIEVPSTAPTINLANDLGLEF